MLEIRNLLFQPLTLHLAKSNESIHLTSRGKATLKDDAISPEIQKAQAKGWVTIKPVGGLQSAVSSQKEEEVIADSQPPTGDQNLPTNKKRRGE